MATTTTSPKTRKMAGTSTKAPATRPSEDIVTFEVVKPFCGLQEGTRRTVRNSPEICETERKGYIKFV